MAFPRERFSREVKPTPATMRSYAQAVRRYQPGASRFWDVVLVTDSLGFDARPVARLDIPMRLAPARKVRPESPQCGSLEATSWSGPPPPPPRSETICPRVCRDTPPEDPARKTKT